MRVTEQIDALEIMGVNSAGFLVLPKIVAGFICIPALVVMSMVLGISSGAAVALISGVSSMADFEYGLQVDFVSYDVVYAIIKLRFCLNYDFGLSLPRYFTSGGAIEVAKSSTKAVVYSVVIIMLTNLILTKLLLT